jgi:AcrR family transcriptional regulator
VAAQVSIDNLSMPVLARLLDVGVTSIYLYFRRKDELLDAMTDQALAQYEFTVPDIDASN